MRKYNVAVVGATGAVGEEMRLVFDIEANGLLLEADKIWFIAAKELGIDTVYEFYPDEIEEGIKFLSQADTLIGHNISGYDLPLIYKLHGVDLRFKDREDTQVMSFLLNPDRGGHSLEDWAIRLKLAEQKVQNEDWSKFTPVMRERCVSDVLINERVYYALKEEMACD